MKWIALLFFLAMNALAMNAAHATDEVYKCSVKGHSVYQSTPCQGATGTPGAMPHSASGPHNDAMPGCYVGKTPGFEDAFEITPVADGEFNVAFTSGGHESTMTMRPANAHDLETVNAQFHLKLRAGVTMEWNAGFPHPKPIGVYKGADANGNEIVFAYFAFGSGTATPVSCNPPSVTPTDDGKF